MNNHSIRNDVVAGVLILAGSGVLFAQTFNFGEPMFDEPGPDHAFFPRLLLLVAISLAVMLILQALRRYRLPESQELISEDDEPRGISIECWAGITVTILYLITLSFGAYFVTTPFYVGAQLWLCGIRRPLPLFGVSLGFVLFVYAVFYLLLSVPLERM